LDLPGSLEEILEVLRALRAGEVFVYLVARSIELVYYPATGIADVNHKDHLLDGFKTQTGVKDAGL